MACTYSYNGETFYSIKELKQYISSQPDLLNSLSKISTTPKMFTLAKTFGGSKILKNATQIFFSDLSKLLDWDKIALSSVEIDGNGDIINVAVNREQALSILWNKYRNLSANLSSINTENEEEKIILQQTYRALSNYKNYKALVQENYPGMVITYNNKLKTMSFNSYNEFIEENDNQDLEFSLDSTDLEANRVTDEWDDKEDKINPVQRLSSAVKDFLFSTTVKSYNSKTNEFEYKSNQDPSKIFAILLNGLTGIHVQDKTKTNNPKILLQEEQDMIKQNFLKLGRVAIGNYKTLHSALYNRIINLLNIAHNIPHIPNNQFELNWVGDNFKGGYEFIDKKNAKKINLQKLNSVTIIDYIYSYIESLPEEEQISIETVGKMFHSQEARDIINSLYSVANSLREKNPYIIRFTKDFVNSSTGKKGISKDFYPTKFSNEGARMRKQKEIINKINNNLDAIANLDKRKKDYIENFFSLTGLRKSFLQTEDVKLVKHLVDDVISEVDKWIRDKEKDYNLFKIIDKYVNDLVGITISTEELIKGNTSYRGGDGNQRWFYTLGSNVTETILRGLKDNSNIKEAHKQSRYLPNWFNFNEGGKILKGKKIIDLVDHDSISPQEKSVFDKPIVYIKEGIKERNIRNFISNFLVHISREKKDFYIQQLYTPSDSSTIISLEVSAIKNDEFPLAIISMYSQFIENKKFIEKAKKNNKTRAYHNYPARLPFDIELSKEELKELDQIYNLSEEKIINLFKRNKILNDLLEKVNKELKTMEKEDFENVSSYNIPVPSPSRLKEIYTQLYDNNLLDITEKEKDTLLELSNTLYSTEYADLTLSNFTSLTEKQRELYQILMTPLYSSFWKNNYFNSHMLSQLVSGFNEEYKNEYAVIKRQSVITSIGSKPRINDETGTKSTFNLEVISDIYKTIDKNTPFLGMFPSLYSKQDSQGVLEGYNISDAQSFSIPWRTKNLIEGYSKHSNIGETNKNIYSGFDTSGEITGVKTSTRELSDEMIKKDSFRRALRKDMEWGRIPINETITNLYINNGQPISLKERGEQVFDNLYDINISESRKLNLTKTQLEIEYNELLQASDDRGYMIHERAFESAVKMGGVVTPTTISIDSNGNIQKEYLTQDKNGNLISGDITTPTVLNLDSDNYRIILNPRKDYQKNNQVSNPNQITYQLATNPNNFESSKIIYKLNAMIHSLGLDKVRMDLLGNSQGRVDSKAINILFQKVKSSLSSIAGQSYLANKMDLMDSDPLGALNLEFVINKVTQTIVSKYEKSTVKFKAPGGGYVLETAAFMENPPQTVFELSNGKTSKNYYDAIKEAQKKYDTEPSTKNLNSLNFAKAALQNIHFQLQSGEVEIVSYYGETHIPRGYVYKLAPELKGQNKTDEELLAVLREYQLDTILGYRIPSTGLHSAIPLKITGFNESLSADNILTVPPEITLLHGSDYDIDKLYIMEPFVPTEDIEIPYYSNASKTSVHKMFFSKGVPITHYRDTKGNIQKRSQAQLNDILHNILNNSKKYIEDQLNLPAQKRKLSKKEISTIYETFQKIAFDRVQKELISVVKDKSNLNNMMKPITLSPINNIEDPNSTFSKILKFTKKDKSSLRPKRNLDRAFHQDLMFMDNSIAKELVGIFASGFKGTCNIYNSILNWDEDLDSETISKTVPKLTQNFRFKWNGELIDGFSREMRDKTLSYTSDEQQDMLINAAVDHVNEQILNVLKIGKQVANEAIAMTAVGLSLFDIHLLVSQPAIKEYVKINSFNGLETTKNNIIYNIISLLPDTEKDDAYIKYEKMFNQMLSGRIDIDPFHETKLKDFYGKDLKDVKNSPTAISNLEYQLEILAGFYKISKIGRDISKAARVSGSSSELPESIVAIQERVTEAREFIDRVDMHNVKREKDKIKKGKLEKKDLTQTNENDLVEELSLSGVFENLKFNGVPHLKTSIDVQEALLEDVSKIFFKHSKIGLDFVLNVFEDKLKAIGLSDYDILNIFISENNDNLEKDVQEEEVKNEEEIQKITKQKITKESEKKKLIEEARENDEYFIDDDIKSIYIDAQGVPTLKKAISLGSSYGAKRLEMASNAIQRVVTYLLSSCSIKSSFVDVSFNTRDQEPVVTTLRERRIAEDKEVELNGLTAWLKSFLRLGLSFTIKTKDNEKETINILSLQELYDKYNEDFPILKKLLPQTKYDKIDFTYGTEMGSIEAIQFEEEMDNLINIPLYEYNEEILTSNQLADILNIVPPNFNHLQANLLKYGILREGLTFGSQRISKNLSSLPYRELVKSLGEKLSMVSFMGRNFSSVKKDDFFDLNIFGNAFMMQYLLTITDNFKSGVWNSVEKEDTKVKKGVENGIFYDAKIKVENSKNIKPFITVGKYLMKYVGTYNHYNYYQSIGRNQFEYAYNASEAELKIPYDANKVFSPTSPGIAVSKKNIPQHYRNNTIQDNFIITVSKEDFNKYGDNTIKVGDNIILYLKGDLIRRFGQEFKINNIEETESGIILNLSKTDMNNFMFDLALEEDNMILIQNEKQKKVIPAKDKIYIQSEIYIPLEKQKEIKLEGKKLSYLDLIHIDNKRTFYIIANDPSFTKSKEDLNQLIAAYEQNETPNLGVIYINQGIDNDLIINDETVFTELLEESLKRIKFNILYGEFDNIVIVKNKFTNSNTPELFNFSDMLNDRLLELGVNNYTTERGKISKTEGINISKSQFVKLFSTPQGVEIASNLDSMTEEEKNNILECFNW